MKAERSSEFIQRRKGHAFFFAGVRGTNDGVRSVHGALIRKFENGATVYNSAFLAERPTADRYQQMATTIKEKLQEGSITITAHSYGAVEAIRALTEDPGLLANPENRGKIKLIFISPVIPENWWGIARDLAKFSKLMVQEGRMFGPVFPGKSSILSGIISANSLRSDVMSLQEWNQAAHLASPKLARRFTSGGREIGDFPRRDYLPLLDQDTQDRVLSVDSRIKDAKESGSRWKTRSGLRERGRLGKKLVYPIFDGNYGDHFGDPHMPHATLGTISESLRLQRKLVSDAGKGREFEKWQQLLAAGIDVWIVNPEQDLMNRGKRARRKVAVPDDHIVTVPFATHASPWTSQPDIFSAIIDACTINRGYGRSR